jgi:prepilin-type processing-associated H-X9-DG protein
MHHDREAPIDVDNNGVFFLNSRLRYEDVSDGSAQTIFIGEIPPEQGGLGWMSGTRATLRNAGIGAATQGAAGVLAAQSVIDSVAKQMASPGQDKKRVDPLLIVGGFGSFHPGGSQFAFGDGHTQFLSGGSSPAVMRLLAHRFDGKLLDQEAY